MLARNRRYDRVGGARLEGIRIASVGNLAVGGTGKTPLTAWMARELSDRGARPAVLMRGYGHDEALLHRRWNPDVDVVVGPDRVAGAHIARARGAGVAILDDGYQHRRLARDLDLVLLAVEDPRPVRVLPAGPYREPWSGLGRADAVVLTRRRASLAEAEALARAVEAEFPGLVRAAVRLAPGAWTDLEGTPSAPPRGPMLAVAAVARPEAFRADVEERSGEPVELLAFADHHEYTASDTRKIARRAAGRTVVVTEKDAVKLVPHGDALGGARVISQELRWDWGQEAIGTLLDELAGGESPRHGGGSAEAGDAPLERPDAGAARDDDGTVRYDAGRVRDENAPAGHPAAGNRDDARRVGRDARVP